MRNSQVPTPAAHVSRRPTRLLWGRFALALVILVGLAIGLLNQLGQAYLDFVPRILGNQTALRASYVASEVRMVNRLLSQVALRYASEGKQLDLKALVSQGLMDPALFSKVQIVDARGDLVHSSVAAPAGLNLSDSEAFRAHSLNDNGRMLVEATAFGGATAPYFSGFSLRLAAPDGAFAGVVLASFKADHLQQALSDIQTRFDGVSNLVGLDGVVLLSLIGQAPQAVHDFREHPFLGLISQGQTQGSYQSQLAADGINRIFVFQKIADQDLVVVSGVAARVWDGLLPSTQRVLYALAAITLAAFLALVLTFQSYATRLNRALAQKERLANQLEESEERLSLSITAGKLGTWDWHLRDNKFRTNELFKLLFKAWPEEMSLESDALQALIHPEDAALFIQALRQHLRGNTPDFLNECRILDAAGAWTWVRIMGRVMARGPDHGPLRLTGTVMDISEQRALQARIDEHSNQLSTIFSLSQDALVVFDQNRRVKFVNLACKRLTHLEPSALLGLHETQFTERLNQMCVPDKPFCGLAALREPGQLTDPRARNQLVLQGPVSRVLQATLTTSQTNSLSQILSLRDVSHETLIEKLKSEFLSTAAHEIRSPMASILGFAELMSNSELTESDRKEFSMIILSQAHRIKGLLDELLDLARIDAGGDQHYVFDVVDLRDLVTNVTTEFLPPDGRAKPTIDVPSLPCRIDADKAAQALLNVISNAYKYSGPSSRVDILYAPPVVINQRKMAGITVRDFGMGMREAELQRVFERFYRANQKSTAVGSGLGMAIVKEIMSLHGGEVVIKSIYGQGTSVTLLFPMDEAAPVTAVPALRGEPERI